MVSLLLFLFTEQMLTGKTSLEGKTLESLLLLPSCGTQTPFCHVSVGPGLFHFSGISEETPLERGTGDWLE